MEKGDTGELTRKEIIDALCEKYPRDAETIHTVMDDCDEMLRISKKSTEVVKRLREAGVEVYYLSNTNPEAFRYMTERYEVFRYMNGGIASFKEGVVKPSEDIFRLFLDRYGKDPSECVFVDDMPTNTESAQRVGLHTITLKNIDDLARELSAFPELSGILSDIE